MFFFFKQKTAYVMRISDWSSDVRSSDLEHLRRIAVRPVRVARGQVAAAQFEARIQRLGRGGAVEVLLETLQQAIVDPAHDRRGPVADLHHLLDAEVAIVVGVEIGRAWCRARGCPYG